jgi:hypothetical protein
MDVNSQGRELPSQLVEPKYGLAAALCLNPAISVN